MDLKMADAENNNSKIGAFESKRPLRPLISKADRTLTFETLRYIGNCREHPLSIRANHKLAQTTSVLFKGLINSKKETQFGPINLVLKWKSVKKFDAQVHPQYPRHHDHVTK
jgi:hypothetical protein